MSESREEEPGALADSEGQGRNDAGQPLVFLGSRLPSLTVLHPRPRPGRVRGRASTASLL